MCGMNVACVLPALSSTGFQRWVNRMTMRRGCGIFIQQGQRSSSVIHLDSFAWGASPPHFRENVLTNKFDYSDSLDAFASYYVNHSVLEIIIDIPFCFSARQMAIYVGM